MGSPSVFHTAPPHPASNARITWSPQFAGGPDASQKGFGQRMPPAKFVVKSAIYASRKVCRLFYMLGGAGWTHRSRAQQLKVRSLTLGNTLMVACFGLQRCLLGCV